MADQPIVEVNGLQLSNGTFGASPPGSLSVADNCVMPQKSVIEPRRGQARAYVPPAAGSIPWAQCEFRGSLIINSASAKFDDFTLGIAANPTVDFSGGPWNPVDATADFAAPVMKFGFAGSYLYFCTTTGPKCLETLSSKPRSAGLLQMPDARVTMGSAAFLGTGGVGLPYGKARAYRSVLRLPTADGTSLLSPPSGRALVSNSLIAPAGGLVRTGGTTVTVTIPGLDPAFGTGLQAGDTFTLSPGEANFAAGSYTVSSVSGTGLVYASAGANVASTAAETLNTGARPTAVTVALSSDATTSTLARIYRSLDTSSATVQPSDEMFLVAELALSAGDIAAGSISYTDVTPSSVLSDPLYTNPQTGEGPTQGNYAPPLYRDTANWAGRQWYAQTTSLQTLPIQLLGVGTPDGAQDGDTLTIDVVGAAGTPYIFTFKNTATVDGEVQIISSGTPSVNIQLTAQNLITQIFNVMTSNGTPLRAYYNSAQNEAPGKVMLQRTTHVQDNITTDGAFSAIASRPATFVPAMKSAAFSSEEYQPNGLAYSKLAQAEAVPPVNYTNIGSKNYPIARIIGLQNSLLVFKRGDGIYSVTGQYPFQVLQVSTANIIAPDACSAFADSAWAYTDQGFLRLTDSGGSSVVSRPIETELNRLRAERPALTSQYAFTVPYETERRVMLFVPFSGDDTQAPPSLTLKAWCYNNATNAWTGPLDYGRPFSGVVGLIANALTLGVYDKTFLTGRVTLERKGTGHLDYADAAATNTITNVVLDGDRVVVRLASIADVGVGDGIIQGQWGTKLRRERPEFGTRYFELYESVPFTAAACSVYRHYDVALQFLPQGAPTSRKTLSRLQLLFKPEWFANYAGVSTVLTDQVQGVLEVATPSTGFGLTPFGQGPFGNPSPMMVDVNPIAPAWATAAQFFVGFSLSEAWPKLRLQGVGVYVDGATGPAGRGSK